MPDQHRLVQPGLADGELDILRQGLEAQRLDGLARAVTHQVERNRLIASGSEARHLRRETPCAAADAVQEHDRDHSGFPSRAGAAGSPNVCISRLAQANIATAWVRSRISRSVRPCARSGAASAGPIAAGSRVNLAE